DATLSVSAVSAAGSLVAVRPGARAGAISSAARPKEIASPKMTPSRPHVAMISPPSAGPRSPAQVRLTPLCALGEALRSLYPKQWQQRARGWSEEEAKCGSGEPRDVNDPGAVGGGDEQQRHDGEHLERAGRDHSSLAVPAVHQHAGKGAEEQVRQEADHEHDA